jgi:transposase InsO family protein
MRKQTRPKRHSHPGGFEASEPFELVVIDMVTHLPESDGNVSLFTIVDVFTKLAVAIPVPNERSETVGRALLQRLFSVYGYPKLILSDRAKGFVSDGLKWRCTQMGIAKINTTGLLPTGAAPVERYHRSLGASLTMVCNKSKNDWSFLVDSVVFAYNISVNETTGYSPFFLTTGRHPNLPISVLTGLRSNTIRHKGHPFVERMTTALNETYRIVRTRQLRTLERNKRYQLGLTAHATDKQVQAALAKRPIPGFRAGELVSYWEPEIVDKDIKHRMPKKFQYRWNGPFAVD